jgi:hypothetical protein
MDFEEVYYRLAEEFERVKGEDDIYSFWSCFEAELKRPL